MVSNFALVYVFKVISTIFSSITMGILYLKLNWGSLSCTFISFISGGYKSTFPRLYRHELIALIFLNFKIISLFGLLFNLLLSGSWNHDFFLTSVFVIFIDILRLFYITDFLLYNLFILFFYCFSPIYIPQNNGSIVASNR